MNQDVSSRRQQELVSQLIELFRQRDNTRQELDRQWTDVAARCHAEFSAQRQQAASKLQQERDTLQAEYQRRLAASRDECDHESRLVSDEFDEKLELAAEEKKTAISDGEYDWFLAKQRLRKEYESDKEATAAQHRRQKEVLKQHRYHFRELAESATDVLGRHRCELVVQGGDLIEDPDDSDHLHAHLQTFTRMQELIRQFRQTFWVRFIEERWFLAVFLLAVLVLVIPLSLALGSQILPTALATAGAAALLSVGTWAVGRSLARKAAHQFLEPFADAIATGKSQLLAARQQAKQHTELKLQTLASELTQRVSDLDQQWKQTLASVTQRYTHRQQELRDWAKKRCDAITQRQATEQTELSNRYEPELARLQEQIRVARNRLDQEESRALAEARSEHDGRFQAMAKRWIGGVADIDAEVTRMQSACARVDFRHVEADRWIPPTDPASAVAFGQVQIDLRQLPGGLSDDRRLQIDHREFSLPAALDLTRSASTMLEYTGADRELATSTTRTLMMRLLTETPAGKLRFTIIDPVGLGQNFSAFMHLADHDEQLVGHRIWTEAGPICQRLTDLTQHMENVIQTYLRNEFASIQDYNQHAGEVAEPFHVLVIADFPAGFTDEAAQRLLSIVQSGPRCGVYTLISVDSNQKLPRNFDIDQLRRNTNVLIAHEGKVHWAEPPMSAFPIDVDPMPSEQVTSQLLHTVGRNAKEANRVEVPFSAVAPEAAHWWTGDSRTEIRVPLGRAGATKLQTMRLGKGTSQHVLISGKTGSGKSTLLHAMITNLALHYAPSEVQFYLIDFKKGVEFKPYAQHRLPHARVIAIESEREFGMSVLQRLDAELRRRGDIFRRIGVQSLAGYRDARPDERMPRILLVIDEFQEFFVKEDKISQDASLLLDRLVRQGRAFGIHVLLGSQTLAGAYSLARATIGQMAVRVALQCSASDAHLILSDDNDAARLLRRPGEAIYNDANGLVEGNHPFQVVWLSDVEKESYLQELRERQDAAGLEGEGPLVFEGNVAAEIGRNELLQKAWEAPAPQDIPLAPRAWVGQAIAIKEAPAAVFHRRSGSNLMLVGQREEAALGVMASCLLSLAAFSPTSAPAKQSRFVVLDGTRPESSEAGYWNRLKETTGLDLKIVKPRDAADQVATLAEEVDHRHQEEDDQGAATFLLIYNLARFRKLQKSEDDFGLGGFDSGTPTSPAERLATILREGPERGVHTLLWSDTYTNLMRWLDRQSLRDIESRVLFQMSSPDSSNLMDSSAAAQLGPYRAILYSEDQGRAERFRPYGLPDDDWLLRVRSWQSTRTNAAGSDAKRQDPT